MNTIKIILTILFIILTAYAFAINPKMHKPFVVTDLNYKITEPVSPNKNTETKQRYNVQPVIEQAETASVTQPQKVIVQVIEEHIQAKPQTVTTVQEKQTPKTIVQKNNQTPPKPQNQNKDLLERVMKNAQAPAATKEQPKTDVKNIPQTEPQQVKTVNIENKPLTEAEEIIVWNKWRSDLQNQVMRDSKITAPYGTTFNFSFTVDKNGSISNINTWSDDNNYTPLAKRVIKPVLTSYQGTSILKFPARTKRTIVNVTGGFTMANTDRYSTPGDYSDYERITR